MSDQWMVQTNNDQAKVLFEGTEADARAFVQQKFPRVHVEPGSLYGEDGPKSDVAVVSPGGSVRNQKGVATWNGDAWSDADKKEAPKRAPAKKAAAKLDPTKKEGE